MSKTAKFIVDDEPKQDHAVQMIRHRIFTYSDFYFDLSPMGSGKTFTALKFCRLFGYYPLIIAPSLSIPNWVNNIANAEFNTQKGKGIVYPRGGPMYVPTKIEGFISHNRKKMPITSYETVSNTAENAKQNIINNGIISEELQEYLFKGEQDYLVIFDETQLFKNNAIDRYKIIKEMVESIRKYRDIYKTTDVKFAFLSSTPADSQKQMENLLEIFYGDSYANIPDFPSTMTCTQKKNKDNIYSYFMECVKPYISVFYKSGTDRKSYFMNVKVQASEKELNAYREGIYNYSNSNFGASDYAYAKMSILESYIIRIIEDRYVLRNNKIVRVDNIEKGEVEIFPKIVVSSRNTEPLEKLYDNLKNRLHDKVQVVTAKTKDRTHAYNSFNTGGTRVLLVGMQISSTSINLNDVYGIYPRIVFAIFDKEILLLQQHYGRFTRMNSKSDTYIVNIIPDGEGIMSAETSTVFESIIAKTNFIKDFLTGKYCMDVTPKCNNFMTLTSEDIDAIKDIKSEFESEKLITKNENMFDFILENVEKKTRTPLDQLFDAVKNEYNVTKEELEEWIREALKEYGNIEEEKRIEIILNNLRNKKLTMSNPDDKVLDELIAIVGDKPTLNKDLVEGQSIEDAINEIRKEFKTHTVIDKVGILTIMSIYRFEKKFEFLTKYGPKGAIFAKLLAINRGIYQKGKGREPKKLKEEGFEMLDIAEQIRTAIIEYVQNVKMSDFDKDFTTNLVGAGGKGQTVPEEKDKLEDFLKTNRVFADKDAFFKGTFKKLFNLGDNLNVYVLLAYVDLMTTNSDLTEVLYELTKRYFDKRGSPRKSPVRISKSTIDKVEEGKIVDLIRTCFSKEASNVSVKETAYYF